MEFGQPPPKINSYPAAWDLVLKDLLALKFSNPAQQKTLGLMLEDCRKRDENGKVKYGTRLQPFNGRNSLKDAYEEYLDAIVYLKNELFELESSKIYTLENETKKAGVLISFRATVNTAMQLRALIGLDEKELNYEFIPNSDNNGRFKESGIHQPNIVVS